jgi:hypothetical protein
MSDVLVLPATMQINDPLPLHLYDRKLVAVGLDIWLVLQTGY